MERFFERHRLIRKWGCIFGGIMMYTLALNLFLVGNNIAAGGISGIAIVLANFVPLSVGAMIFVMNVPILTAALIINGWRYTLDTIFSALIYSLAVDLLANMPTLTDNPLVAAVFGGVIYGAGVALLAMGNGSTGGTDLISRLLVKKNPNISIGKMLMLVEGSIVVFAMLALRDIEVGLYAIITVIVCSVVGDRILLGFDRGCLCMIITGKSGAEVSAPLMQQLKRAVTKVDGMGMYAASQRNVLFVAVRPSEVAKVKELLWEVDSEAFVMVLPANELLGGGFQSSLHK